jgi:CRP-like cAMP-binding protein
LFAAFLIKMCTYNSIEHSVMEQPDQSIALSRFRKTLESFTPFTDAEFLLWTGILHQKQVSKGEVLLKEGQVCRHFYFIVKGCLRSFGIEEGREVNLNFYFEDDFACDFDSFRYEEPSRFYIVAMEDALVYAASKSEALPVLQSGSAFSLFLFRFFQAQYFKETEHSNAFKLLTPDQRYNFLLKHKPHYLQRIPVLHLASYLGMSRETLTRIRRKIT